MADENDKTDEKSRPFQLFMSTEELARAEAAMQDGPRNDEDIHWSDEDETVAMDFAGTDTMVLDTSEPPLVPESAHHERDAIRPFPFERLETVELDENRNVDDLHAALFIKEPIEELSKLLAQRMHQLLGIDHRVKFGGAGPVMTNDLDEGLWTWGRLPPAHHRFGVGIDRWLAVDWLDVAAPDHDVIGDDFEFGIATFLMAEFVGVITEWAGWPTFSWAVNPMEHRDLETLLFDGVSPPVEMVFEVRPADGRGLLKLWFPPPLVRRLRQATSRLDPVFNRGERWWGRLDARAPLIVGTTELEPVELERLALGDILVVQRHGVMLEHIADSARPNGTRWPVCRNVELTGQLVRADGRWHFQVDQRQLQPRSREVNVADDDTETEDLQRKSPLEVPVETAHVEVRVQLGKVSMELEDLARLRKGQIIDCQQPLDSPVELTVSGATVGRGELVDIDGRLGVRILAMNTSSN